MKNWNELNIIEKAKLISLGTSIILLTILVIQNYKAVQLSIFFWDLNVSLILLIALSGALGFTISYLKDSIKFKRMKSEMEEIKNAKQAVERPQVVSETRDVVEDIDED